MANFATVIGVKGGVQCVSEVVGSWRVEDDGRPNSKQNLSVRMVNNKPIVTDYIDIAASHFVKQNPISSCSTALHTFGLKTAFEPNKSRLLQKKDLDTSIGVGLFPAVFFC